MCGKIDCFVEAFSHLRTDKNRKRWSAANTFHAPHKPFLLLSILDLVAQGRITRNFIEPTFELAETFAGYWQQIMPPDSSGNMAYPFFYMDSESFWTLVLRPGVTPPRGKVVSSMKRIRELYLGAKLDEQLFLLLLMEPLRRKLRNTLVQTYFAPEIQPMLLEQSRINIDANEYSDSLLKKETAELPTQYFAEDEIANKVRDQGFRKAIVTLYDHRCALCGIRIRTLDGHTVVEAAHIIPWRESQDDQPTNGLALCRLCHWSFDEGLMGVGKHYEVLISKQVKREPNFPGHMLTLSDRPIFKPAKFDYWPAQEKLERHRKKVLRK
ncbi:MAG: HNH endonuclease [Desulfobulbaceae bacterium]|nr:HNH endonuclease [Desulfobulbaceae bacterium]